MNAHSGSSPNTSSSSKHRDPIWSIFAASRTGTPIEEKKPLLPWRDSGAVPPAILGRSRKRWNPRTRNASAAARWIAGDGTDQDGGAPATEVFPGFRIRLVGDSGAPFRTRLRITHEPGQWSEQVLDEKETFLTFWGLTAEAGGTWLLSLYRYDYQGVDSQPMRWPVRKTLVLKAIDGDAPDITVEIESLQYTYEPDVEGPIVAYPARGDRGPAA